MSKHENIVVFLALLLSSPVVQAQVRSSASYAITVDQVNSGGGIASSTGYALRGTIGQPIGTAPMASANYALAGGLQAGTPAPALGVNPATLSFSSQAVGSTSTLQPVTLTNAGNVAVGFASIGVVGTNPGDFTQDNNCGSILAVAASCTVNVSFAPTTAGVRAATLRISSSVTGTHDVGLSGTGVSPGALDVTPGTLTFALQPVNTQSATQTVTVSNTGASTLTVSSWSIGGANLTQFARTGGSCNTPVVLVPGATCTLAMLFQPTSAGAKAASLTVSSSVGSGVVTLSGTGTAGMVRFDLDGDAKSDVVWRNAGSGDNYLYPMTGLAIGAGQGYLRNVPSPWMIAGVGDFDGDGKADLLWRNATTGDTYIFLMNGTAVVGETYGRNVPTDWAAAGIADLNGDGKADIVWRNATTGDNYVYFMNGLGIAAEGYLPNVPSPWTIATMGDLDGDGKADLFWRNTSTGDTYFFLMNGLTIASQGYGRNVPTSWNVIGAGDYNGDGKADLLWRNAGTGDNYLYLLEGMGLVGEGYVRNVPAPWTIVGTGDYDGDGKADILWRNIATGEDYLFLMNGLGIASEGYLPNVPIDWAVVQ